VGEAGMSWPNSFFVLVSAILAVYWEAAFAGLRHLLGAQVDLLPPLMVYAGLFTGIPTITCAALLGGCCFDALSANPLGVTVLPLFTIGMVVHYYRELVLREQTFAQLTLGFFASAAAPVLCLLVLLTTGHKPTLGWSMLWQWAVMIIGGTIATPICFELFQWLRRALVHSGTVQSSFRPDREIRRGRC
jgi:rod shape-determining protein MreD